jgi:alpha-glucosidase
MRFSSPILAAAPVAHAGNNARALALRTTRSMGIPCLLLLGFASMAAQAPAAEQRVAAPGGGLAVVVSDDQGLSFRVEIDRKTVVNKSALGLEFEGGVKLGPSAMITKSATASHDGKWENRFGNNRVVPDKWRELRLTLEERGEPRRVFGVIVRAFDNGVAFRYDLPEASALGKFVLTNELTEFRFADDYRCWAGAEGGSAEVRYPETKLSAITAANRQGRPFRSVLPLLVETPAGYIAVAESDLLDWAGMSITGTGTTAVKVTLDPRTDGRGLVESAAPRLSPWRVLMFGRTATALAGNELIATLATPSKLKDTSWIKPGPSAWDPWWTGTNPYDPDPRHTNVNARGSTQAGKEYIDLASQMGWPYQLADWYWYKNMTLSSKALHSKPNDALGDFSQADPQIDLPELIQYAKSKNVRMLIWAHSLDMVTFGVEKTLDLFAKMGFAGVKVDFINSQSQDTVVWCEKLLVAAAERHLLIDIHGTYKPTGMARTYPNFITQEGVLGNEYNKLGGKQVTALHTATLPFTRALLGPMDYTPGGFLNRTPQEFKTAVPAQTMGTRAHELALTVAYPSPLMIFCDSPKNYRGQVGLDFLRQLPTVWDESVVLEGEVGKSFVVARRSGERWYLVGLNGEDAAQRQAPLKFLDKGKWTMRSFADKTDSADYTVAVDATRDVNAETVLPLSFLPGGGFAAILSKAK